MAAAIRAVQGQSETFTLTLSGGTYTGSETLAGTVSTGTGEPALLSPTPVWTPGQSVYKTVDVAFTGSDLATLAPGGYILNVTVNGAGGAFVSLRVLPGVGTTAAIRTLVTPGQALAFNSDLATNQAQLDALAPALAAATRVMEAYCRKALVLTSFDRIYRPGRTRKIYLHAWPVAPGLRIKVDLSTAFTITNTSIGTYQVGYSSMTPTSYYSWTPKTLSLTTIDSSSNQVVVPLTLASYANIGALTAAINAAGNGWSAAMIGNSYNSSRLSSWPCSELLYDPGCHGALNQQYDVYVYTRDIVRYGIDFNRGTVELTENRPEAYRYPDRAYGIGFGWSWSAAAEPRHAGARCTYQAGYAVQAADIASGIEPAPEDLQYAAVLTAQSILATTPLVGPVNSQAVKDRSYDLVDNPEVIPCQARKILDQKYANYRFAMN
jgi:hypothetical protein